MRAPEPVFDVVERNIIGAGGGGGEDVEEKSRLLFGDGCAFQERFG